MATTAKKFVKVTGVSSVFATSSASGNWHGYDISQIKTGVTAADNNSILFIQDETLGKWIWAQGRMYSGNETADFDIVLGTTGVDVLGATYSFDSVGNWTGTVWHKGSTIATGTTTASAGTEGSNFTFTAVTDVETDGVGHATKQVKTEFTIPVAGVTGDTTVKVGKSGTQYYITHATGASGTFTSSKTASSNEVTVTNPVLTFDSTGHLTSTGSTSYKITAADLGVDGVLHFLGVTTSSITDGSTTNPITIGGESVTAQKGDVVLYGTKEFVWSGTEWKELGDQTKYLLGATGNEWISTSVANGIVTINHTLPTGSVQGSTQINGIVSSVTYDAQGHVRTIGTTSISTPKMGATSGSTNTSAKIVLSNGGTGIVTITSKANSGITVNGPTSSDTNDIYLGTTGLLKPTDITVTDYGGSGTPGTSGVYDIAVITVAGGSTTTLHGRDTTYTIGTTAVNGTSGAEIKTTFTPSKGTATTITTPIISPDDSIVVGATQGKVVVNYTGVATNEDWGFIPETQLES